MCALSTEMMKGVGHTTTKIRMLWTYSEGNVAPLTKAFVSKALLSDNETLAIKGRFNELACLTKNTQCQRGLSRP